MKIDIGKLLYDPTLRRINERTRIDREAVAMQRNHKMKSSQYDSTSSLFLDRSLEGSEPSGMFSVISHGLAKAMDTMERQYQWTCVSQLCGIGEGANSVNMIMHKVEHMGTSKRDCKREEYKFQVLSPRIGDIPYAVPWSSIISQTKLNDQEVPDFFNKSEAMRQTLEIIDDEEIYWLCLLCFVSASAHEYPSSFPCYFLDFVFFFLSFFLYGLYVSCFVIIIFLLLFVFLLLCFLHLVTYIKNVLLLFSIFPPSLRVSRLIVFAVVFFSLFLLFLIICFFFPGSLRALAKETVEKSLIFSLVDFGFL